jgi:hypothetical protein
MFISMRVRMLLILWMIISSAAGINAQPREIRRAVDSLRAVTWMGYGCEDIAGSLEHCGDMEPFWRVTKFGKKALPYLISVLDDTTQTQVAVPYMGYQYTVGDIAFEAIQTIVPSIDDWQFVPVKFDSADCGGCTYWRYVNKDIAHRKKIKGLVRKWYTQNENKLVWVRSDDRHYPPGGYYTVR